MSAAHDAHADASAAHHDAHDHFDNEPATELGADEPRTPNWIPILGMSLFFIAGIAWLFSGDADKPTEDKPAGAEAAAVAQPTPPSPPPQIQARPVAPNPGNAAPNPPNALQQLSPEKARELQKQIEAIRAMRGEGNGNPAAAPPGAQPQPVRPAQPTPPVAVPHPDHPGH